GKRRSPSFPRPPALIGTRGEQARAPARPGQPDSVSPAPESGSGRGSAQLAGELDEAVSPGQQAGNSGGDAPGRAPLGVVHVADQDGAVPGGGNRAADLPGGKGGPAVAVDGERHDALSQVGNDARRDVVAVGGARPEEARRLAQEAGELGLVPGDLVADLAGAPRAGDAVGRSPGDRQREVPGAVVGDLEQRLSG